ncbi:hypothetical protein Tco_1230570, partial [Tanacetum coccineum]
VMSTPAHPDLEISSQTVREEDPLEVEEFHPLVYRAPLTNEKFKVLEPSDTRITPSHSLASSDSTYPGFSHPYTHPNFVPP